jgi:hypothetical protein
MTYFTLKLMGLPMGFYEWHICNLYLLFSEAAGHSGLRIHATSPNPLTRLMRILDAELVIEESMRITIFIIGKGGGRAITMENRRAFGIVCSAHALIGLRAWLPTLIMIIWS